VSPIDELTDFERKIIDNVRKHGCHINYVFDPNGEDPAFAYSVGFHETLGQPEVIVFGLSADLMKFMINETMRQCRAGLRLEDGMQLHGLLEGHWCMPCAIPSENIRREHFNSAMWFRRLTTGEDMEDAFQIVWPGAEDGLFPWEDGASPQVRNLQLCLFAEDNSQ
jgi:hypothetical protein